MKTITIPFRSFFALLLLFSLVPLLGFSQAKEMKIGGIKVIFVPSAKEIVHVNMVWQGGNSILKPEEAGIGHLALNWLTEGGSETWPKLDFHRKIEQAGAGISATAHQDYLLLSLNCLKPYWAEVSDLFTSLVSKPAYDSRSFELVKEKLITQAKSSAGDPDDRLRQAAFEQTFRNHPYAFPPLGTEATLSQLNESRVKTFLSEELLTKGKDLFFVVVGKLTEAEIRDFVENILAALPESKKISPSVAQLLIKENKTRMEERDIATNYIRGIFSMPPPGHPDEAVMRLAVSILSKRLFVEIRTKRNLSYSPWAAAPFLRASYGIVYVSTTEPDTAVAVIQAEIAKIKREGFSMEELIRNKNTYITEQFMRLETASSLADYYTSAEIAGSWQRVLSLPETTQAVTLEQMNEAFRKWVQGIEWIYLGKKESYNPATFLEKQPETPQKSPNKPY